MYFRREGKSVEGESVLQAYSWQGRGASSKNNEGIVAAFFCTSNGKIESNGLVSVHVTLSIPSLCLCGPTGRLHYLQEGGECVERCKIDGQPLFLRLHNPRQILAIVTHEMMLIQYSINLKGETTLLMNVRY